MSAGDEEPLKAEADEVKGSSVHVGGVDRYDHIIFNV